MFKNKLFFAISILILFLLGMGICRQFNFSAHPVKESSHADLQIPYRSRLLVIAPHPDDEVLGTGGLIQRVLNSQGTVGMVLLTNGDGFSQAVRKVVVRNAIAPLYPEDYIQLGYMRRNESFSAMTSLGIAPKDLFFLGYPDRGLDNLWKSNWERKNPFRSPHTQAESCPYRGSYLNHALYAGENLESDLRRIIRDFQPTIIAYPHSEDEHPDHATAFSLVKLAIIQSKIKSPTELLYVVHHRGWPRPMGFYPNNHLLPPHKLLNNNMRWLTLPLTSGVLQQKAALIGLYKSQISTIKGFYYTFARRNEIFGTESPVYIPRRPSESVRLIVMPPEKIPILPGAISGINAQYAEKKLWFILNTEGEMTPGNEYMLDLTLLVHDRLAGRIVCTIRSGQTSMKTFSIKPADLAGISLKYTTHSLSVGFSGPVMSRINGLMVQGNASPSNWRDAQRTISRVVRFNQSPIFWWR